ncbi:hypothetical protein GCM10009817_00430 [Terrabacter lapilli]|uniref:Lipoprotein n=1 Tax=Terrabacter lapilli TaxID=436231 RepID=A0ABN2JYD1_9MICO
MTTTRVHTARHIVRDLVVSAAAVGVLAGCTQGVGATATLPTTSARTPTTTSAEAPSPSTTTPSAPTSSPATPAPAPEVGKALAAAIDDLSAKKRNLVRLDAARKQLVTGNEALRQARIAVTAMRSDVYGTTRNCSAAWVQNGIIRTKAGVANGSANAVMTVVGSRRAQLAVLAQTATTVERQVAAQHSTLASLPNVKAAVEAARSTVVTEGSATTKINEAAMSLRSNATQVSASGSQIMAKTC